MGVVEGRGGRGEGGHDLQRAACQVKECADLQLSYAMPTVTQQHENQIQQV